MSAREIVIRLVFSTVSTVGLSILFYIRPRRLPLATLGGFLTYAVYLLVHTVLASEFVCNMLASLAGALYAELLARRTRVPVTVYTIPCVIPLVPGSVLYRTMSSLVQSRLSDAVTYGLNTVTVALGRAIVRNPKVFLLDEPLSNLDAKLRATMRTELTKIHNRVGTTFIYVTHDQVEAMTMATRIVVMKDGLIQQVDTPQNLYDSPCNLFVAGFIGTPQMNFINGTLTKKGEDMYFNFEDKSIKLPAEKANDPALKEYVDREVIVGLRPECIHDQPAQVEVLPDSTIDAYVDVTELMGAEIYLYLTVGETNLIARVSSRSTSRAGDTIKVAFDTSRIHIFDKDTERCIAH